MRAEAAGFSGRETEGELSRGDGENPVYIALFVDTTR